METPARTAIPVRPAPALPELRRSAWRRTSATCLARATRARASARTRSKRMARAATTATHARRPYTCQAGTCNRRERRRLHRARTRCHAPAVCDPANGTCSNPAKPNGTTCTDGNACTQDDTCQAGSCVGADPVTCSCPRSMPPRRHVRPRQRHVLESDEAERTSCNDGDLCTQSDTCQAGACQGANPVSCAALDDCHQVGSCDPTTGLCSNPIEPDGTACANPGQPVPPDPPVRGRRVHGLGPGDMPADRPVATTRASCNTQTGTCSNPAKPDGSACNDGNLCTQTDIRSGRHVRRNERRRRVRPGPVPCPGRLRS
jgi:hypothetical protein